MTDRIMPWSCYRLPNRHKIYLTSRPDSYAKEGESFSSSFYLLTGDYPKLRLYFTDDLILDKAPTVTPSIWVPWFVDEDKRESDNPTLSSIATAVSLIKSYECDTLWLHCDSSTMRAPTFFGLFLHTFYPDETDAILATRTTNMPENHHWSSPKGYAQINIDRDPKCLVVLEQIRSKYAGSKV